MGLKQLSSERAFLYDDATQRIVGVKSPDGSELLFMRIPYLGAFSDLSDQTALINTATPITFDTTEISHGVEIVADSQITVRRKAIYNLAFSAQFLNTGTDEATASLWLSRNGTPVANSNGEITVPKKHGSDDGKSVAAWNFFVEAEENDWFELSWSTPVAAVSIAHLPAQTAPVRPATPSIILTVNEVDGSYPY